MTDPDERPRRTDETEHERLDRELEQLVNEMRLAMPGVQVLFAFLLAVPFAPGFKDVGPFGRDVYVFSVVCAALSCAFMIAPTAYHRIMFRRGDKSRLIKLASAMTITGLAFLGLAMNAAIFLATDAVLDQTQAIVITSVTAVVFLLLWFGLAAARRLRGA